LDDFEDIGWHGFDLIKILIVPAGIGRSGDIPVGTIVRKDRPSFFKAVRMTSEVP
jgi:hypothetical protein